jgi:hypothetical protein
MATKQAVKYSLEIEAPANGRIRKSTVVVRDADGKSRASDTADLSSDKERRRLARSLARQLHDEDAGKWQKAIETKWDEVLDEQRRVREQQAAGAPEAAAIAEVQLLDTAPPILCRPLCLLDGKSYAAAWNTVKTSRPQSVQNGIIVKHDPPLVTVEDVLLIVAGDGGLYTDAGVPDARPLRELGLPVRLPSPLPPGKNWSGAGVKRYRAGERPDPACVFGRVVAAVNRFIDFARSLAPQQTMCELTACYILSTYFLDAFHVVGYLWPNGEKGSGKTTFLEICALLGYLGQMILAGSSYACLRDMADYGATLCFDDAEIVMDTRRTDPDKRTLLLAGNRKGATVAVKELEGERWVIRHISAFCPRLFSAIRLPDEVLGSRSVIIPLIRSGDPLRVKADVQDSDAWPCDRRRLVDDLWALGLEHLPQLPHFDRLAAELTKLAGRALDPWRPVLAVAAWLQDRHGIAKLYDRIEALAVRYQEEEREDYEAADSTRVLLRALLLLTEGHEPARMITFRPRDVAEKMKAIALTEDLTEGDRPFTTARRVGWLLKRQRFRRGGADKDGKLWQTTRSEIEMACAAYAIPVMTL